MKQLSFLLFALSATVSLTAQDNAQRPSPSVQATGTIGTTKVIVSYGQPSVKGRKIWGELVPYGQVWRAGANETTSMMFTENVNIEGKKLTAGNYAFFIIPNEKEWTIIFNKAVR